MKDLKENNHNGYSNNSMTLFLRFFAFVIDILIIQILSLGIFLQFYIEEKSLGNILYLLNSYIVVLIVMFLVNAFLYSTFGGSLGKVVLGLVVRGQGKNFLNFRDYFFREYIAKNLSNMLFGIGYLYILFNKKQQSFHDLASNTTVSHKLTIKNLIFVLLVVFFSAFIIFSFGDKLKYSKLKQTSIQHSQQVMRDLLYHLGY